MGLDTGRRDCGHTLLTTAIDMTRCTHRILEDVPYARCFSRRAGASTGRHLRRSRILLLDSIAQITILRSICASAKSQY